MARNDEFNRDMGSYLRSRKVVRRTNPFLAAKSYFMNIIRSTEKKQQKEAMPEPQGDISPEAVQAVIAASSVKPTRSAPVRTTSGAEQLRMQQKPAPQKVKSMGWFNKRKEEDYEEVTVQQPVLDEDVRDVLKITFKWLKQMDPEQIDEIKRSPDFEKYKAVLDKYGLIKK